MRSLLLAALAGLLSGAAAAQPAAPRPNFLVILSDDQRADAAGFAGNAHVRTPHLDALAARGVRFTNSFVTTSICSPSRAAHLTGLYGSANGVMSLQKPTIAPGRATWAQALRQAGYRTAHVGKWHLLNSPADLGFDSASYFEANGAYYGRTVFEDGPKRKVAGHLEDYAADRAVAFLKGAEGGDRPFALWLCTQLPHLDHRFRWDATAQSLTLYDPAKLPVPASWADADLAGKPPYLKTARHRTKAVDDYGYDREDKVREHLRDYYATLTDMDAALGRVLRALDDLKLRDNTYVIFSSDNGWLLGEHQFTSKVLAYEASIRVPMVVAGPGIAPARDDRLVLNVDIAPTILDLAGLKPPPIVHGQSLVPLLKPAAHPAGANPPAWRTGFRYEALKPELGSHPLEAVRTGRWKYIRTLGPGCDAGADPEFEELYDLSADPHELKNLASDVSQRETLAGLRAELVRLRAAIAPSPAQ